MDFYLFFFFFFLEDFCRQQFACTIRSGAPWWRWGRARGLPFPFLLPVVGRFSHTLIERGEEIGTSTFFSDNSVGEGSHRNHLFFSGFLRFYGVLFCHVRFCKEWFSFWRKTNSNNTDYDGIFFQIFYLEKICFGFWCCLLLIPDIFEFYISKWWNRSTSAK